MQYMRVAVVVSCTLAIVVLFFQWTLFKQNDAIAKFHTEDKTLTSASYTSTRSRVLLYITTYPNLDHLEKMRTCWPALIRKSTLLAQADI